MYKKPNVKTCALFAALFALFAFPAASITLPAQPAEFSVRLGWDPNPETDIKHYTIYYGETGSSSIESVNVAPSSILPVDGREMITGEVSGLLTSKAYSFVVTATNEAGLESLPSNEITLSRPAAPAFPVLLRINADGSVEILNPL
jgi:hypothetical protein